MRRVTGRIILKHFALWTADRRQRTTVQSKCSHRPRQRKPSRLRRGGRRRRARRRWHVRGPAGSLLGARSGREHVAVCQRKLLEPHHGLRTCSARCLRPPGEYSVALREYSGTSLPALRSQRCDFVDLMHPRRLSGYSVSSQGHFFSRRLSGSGRCVSSAKWLLHSHGSHRRLSVLI